MRTRRLFRIALVLTMLTCGRTSQLDCNSCAAGTYSEAVAATTIDTCQQCPSNSQSPSASDSPDDCTCDTDYVSVGSGLNLTCIFSFTTCPPGEFLENNVCNDCEAGKYKNDNGSHVCYLCRTHSTSEIKSKFATDCKCNAGYDGADVNTCTACVAGKYKESSGNVVCDSCVEGKYSRFTATQECEECFANSTSYLGSKQGSDCRCNKGYTSKEGYMCALCEVGKYKSVDDSVDCTPCSGGFPSIMSLGAISELECNGYNLSSGRIIEFNITTGKQLNLNVTTVKSVVVDFVHDVSTLVHVYRTISAISNNSDFGVRLFVPDTNMAPLILSDIYARLQSHTSLSQDYSIIFLAGGTISLHGSTPQVSLGDRIFFHTSALRIINPISTTIISQNRETSPKNVRIFSSPKIAHLISQACIGLSCQCQKNFLQYCGNNLRTLT